MSYFFLQIALNFRPHVGAHTTTAPHAPPPTTIVRTSVGRGQSLAATDYSVSLISTVTAGCLLLTINVLLLTCFCYKRKVFEQNKNCAFQLITAAKPRISSLWATHVESLQFKHCPIKKPFLNECFATRVQNKRIKYNPKAKLESNVCSIIHRSLTREQTKMFFYVASHGATRSNCRESFLIQKAIRPYRCRTVILFNRLIPGPPMAA